MRGTMRGGGLLAALSMWLCSSAGRAASPPLDSRTDDEIEAALPEIEGARLAGRLPQLHPRYLDRTDRAGKILAAWTLADDQEAWNALRAQSSPDRPEPWSDVGTAAIYLRWKTFDQVAAALKRARSLAPKLAEALVVQGDAARAQGDAAAAAAAYREALALRPSDVFALDGLGRLALAAGTPAEAEPNFAKAKAAFPDDPVADQGLADARLARGDAPGALAALEDLHRVWPSSAPAWLASGKLRLKQGDAAGAARDFEQARRLGSSDPDLLKLLSETYQGQGRTDDERRLLDDLISQGAASAPQYARRSQLREANDLPGALSDLRKAAQLDPNDLDLALRLAALTAKSGALGEAIGLYRDLVPKKPEAKPALEALEAQAGLLKKPLKGTIAQINSGLSVELNRLYRSLLKKAPTLKGALKIRVTVNEKGDADDEEILDDTVKSPELAANLRWNAHLARYPAAAARYTFKFALNP